MEPGDEQAAQVGAEVKHNVTETDTDSSHRPARPGNDVLIRRNGPTEGQEEEQEVGE